MILLHGEINVESEATSEQAEISIQTPMSQYISSLKKNCSVRITNSQLFYIKSLRNLLSFQPNMELYML